MKLKEKIIYIPLVVSSFALFCTNFAVSTLKYYSVLCTLYKGIFRKFTSCVTVKSALLKVPYCKLIMHQKLCFILDVFIIIIVVDGDYTLDTTTAVTTAATSVEEDNIMNMFSNFNSTTADTYYPFTEDDDDDNVVVVVVDDDDDDDDNNNNYIDYHNQDHNTSSIIIPPIYILNLDRAHDRWVKSQILSFRLFLL